MRGEGHDLREVLEGVIGHFPHVELFDFDAPMGRNGVLRVYISTASGQVALDDCSAISRAILDLEMVEEILPGGCSLEVSSPGINRRLRLPRHFFGAIGERVKVTAEADGKRVSFRGQLKSFDGDSLELTDEDTGENRKVAFSEVTEARVDFAFK